MPQNAALAARTLWRTADAIWRAAGDQAADFSHYTKRATAGAVYSATLLVWLNDESEGFADTAAFLDRRINDVMRFERARRGGGRAQRTGQAWSVSLAGCVIPDSELNRKSGGTGK